MTPLLSVPLKVDQTHRTLQRKCRELAPTYFHEEERGAFCDADTAECRSFLGTGAVQVVLPQEALQNPPELIWSRPPHADISYQHEQ